jgi:hypothetical protein
MAEGIPRALVSWLMAATVLAWSLSPPAVEHAHEGGADLTHQHDCAAATDGTYGSDHAHDAHSSEHAHDAEHTHSVAVVSAVPFGDASHFHFQWLGFRLTLPGDSLPTKKGDGSNTSKLLFVQASRPSLSQFQLGTRFDDSLTPLCLDAMATDIAATCPAVSGSLPLVKTHPLCDRARHERSGVLLA